MTPFWKTLKPEKVSYPVYLLSGDAVEIEGQVYLMPEPVACATPGDLVGYVFEKRLVPLGRLEPAQA